MCVTILLLRHIQYNVSSLPSDSDVCDCDQVNVPSTPVGGGGGEKVECEVTGSVEQIDRALALIEESIQQSELSRRQQALHRRQKTRKPAVSQ